MKNRIQDKKEEIKKYLHELSIIKPKTLKEYSNDLKSKAACERYFEKIINASIDLAFLIAKYKNLKLPDEDETNIFNILKTTDNINEDLSRRLKQAKGMRNIIAHEYGKVDDELIFNSITYELEIDIHEFIKLT